MIGSRLLPVPLHERRGRKCPGRRVLAGSARGLAGWLVLLPLFAAAADEQPPAPQQLLANMAAAYDNRTFSGRFLYMRAGEVSTLALDRAVIEGREYERLTHLQGRPTTVIRNNGRTVSVQSDETVTLVASNPGISPLGFNNDGVGIPDQYNARLAGADRVAGRPCWRLELEPRDRHRYGYRLWIDRESSLPLKSEVVDGDQGTLERVEFISLELDPRLERQHFSLPEHLAAPAGGDVEASDNPRIAVDWLPAGFAMAAREAHRFGGRTGVLNSATYSDGLTAFTLFLERASEAGQAQSMRRRGPTVVLAREFGNGQVAYRAILVGEIPPGTARRVLDGVTLEPDHD